MRPALLALSFALAAAPPAAALVLKGVVVETVDDGARTFVRLDTAVGERWAAVPATKLSKGAAVVVDVAAVRQGYESRTLKRTFDRMIFGSLAGSSSPALVPERDPIKVGRAAGPGARTVAEIHAMKAALKGTEVLVRAKVVKATLAVNDLNWIHLRDGTGEARTGDHDLTVATKEAPAVGSVVTVRGKVALQRDLGAGYKFPVLLEDARTEP